MTVWNPTLALFWESWRLSRRRLAIAIVVSTVGGAAILASPISRDFASILVLQLALAAAWFGQMWTAGVDMRKGFTLTLGFTRPVVTWKLVSVPLALTAVSAAVGYLVPVVLLRGLFGVPFPLLPLAAICAGASLLTTAIAWWTEDLRLRALAGFGLWILFLFWYWGSGVISDGTSAPDWTRVYSLSAAAYGRWALASAMACVLAIVGVGRQRHGDDLGKMLGRAVARTRTSHGGGLLEAIRSAIRFAFPVTTPIRAQLWFEAQTVGAGILASGVRIALILLVLLALAARSDLPVDVVVVGGFWAIAAPAIAAIRFFLGLERKQGRVRMSPYARTRAVATARIVALKVVVVSLALLGAWTIAFGAVWMLGGWLGFGDAALRAALEDYLPSLAGGWGSAFLVAVLSVHGASLLAWAGGLQVLFVLNARRVMMVGLGIIAYGTVVVTLAVRGWLGGEVVGYAHLGAVALGFIALMTHLFIRLIAEKVLTGRTAALLLGLGLAFALATRDMNVQFVNPGGSGIEEQVVAIFLGLLPLGAAAFAPWAFSRLRHQ